ncbi:hypothetical protein [Synechococcus sp. LA31]|uniref:hypothetical protein n=1 Tax=Synechococcus sp. LA31 TaxID=2741953 RepID=UPI001BDCDA26|nr:hypothetical protein [Synechococcus sp. LA31]QVV67088.1 hypothetical protein KJJ24_11590 [Synechococcus sp. LA31]
MRVQVCIPHYFREHTDPGDNPNGYGSLRSGAKLQRSIALARCITALLDLQRKQETCLLNINQKSIEHWQNKEEQLEISIHVFTDGINRLQDTLDIYKNNITISDKQLKNPRELPLECRDYLIKNETDADLLFYMEDDIIINDRLFFDKQKWFIHNTSHNCSLMPHRYERIDQGSLETLIVDGSLRPDFINRFTNPQKNAANGQFRGSDFVCFDIADNPHSGTFCVSRDQAEKLRDLSLPREGFVGPLETAATLTVLKFFPVMKPSIQYWKFLSVEHGHPSFLPLIKTLPHQAAS